LRISPDLPHAATVFPSTDQVKGALTERTFADLLIDCEEDRTLWAVLVGMLREADQARAVGLAVEGAAQ
jgi:hypothetical protein